ncbi:hypothetical protein GYH30_048755 [Glycine max]|uniref:Uncharacterized protein n=1 Tax=Glycine max TaxID=3847 RepID=A0A0R0F4T6_SOYBN|nr:hypothetical protein JHK87_048758 [Glycine soja]KAH1152794.1 hypothetical protein GYH30_048755 [Glycine max]
MLLAQCYGFVFPCRSASEDMDQSLQLQIFRFQFQWHDQGVEIYFDIDGKEEDHHLFLWLFQIMEINCKQPFETFTHIISTSEMFTHHSMRFIFIKENLGQSDRSLSWSVLNIVHNNYACVIDILCSITMIIIRKERHRYFVRKKLLP